MSAGPGADQDQAPDPAAGPRRGVAGSSALMFAGTLVSRVLGMVKAPLLLGAAVGINYGAANAFAVANKLPNLIYMLIAGGVLNAILVPQIVRAIKNDADGGRTYVNRLLTVGMAGLAVVTVALTLASPLLISLYAANLPPQWYDLAVTFGYWCIPQLFFYGTYTLFGQVLNARNVFGPYMWAPALNNLVAIAGLAVYLLVFGGTAAAGGDDASVWGLSRTALLAGTATLGIVAQALVLLVPLYRSGFRYRPVWGLRGSGLGSASRMAMWVFAALAANQVAYVVISNAAAYAFRAGDGARDVAGNGAYDTAFLIFTLPTSLVTVSLVTALFTRMSASAAAADLSAVRADLSKGLRTVSVFTVFAAGLLMVLAQPVVRVVAATVSFDEVRSIGHVVVAMVPGLVAVGIFTMCQRVFYAFEDAKGLFRLQIPMFVILAVGAAASMLLPAQWTVVGIGVAMTVSNTVAALLTFLGLRLHLYTVDGARVLRTHLRLVLALIPAVAVAWGLLHVIGTGPQMGVLGALWRIGLVGAVAGLIYLALLRALHVGELQLLAAPAGAVLLGVGSRIPGGPGGAVVRAGRKLSPASPPPRPDDGPDGDGPGGPGADFPPPPPPPPPPHETATDPERADLVDDGATPPAATRATSPGTAPALRTLDSDGAGVTHEGTGGTALNQGTDDAHPERSVLGERYELGESLETTVGGIEKRRARDLTLEADVDVLVLPTSGTKVADVLDAARRASLVDDHRLVTVLDVGTDESASYVVTRTISGPDLGTLAGTAGLPPEQARAVVGETTAALQSARRHGVRHLALRPECVHVTPDGDVLVSGLGTDAVLLGAPEEFADSPLEADHRDAADIVRLLYLALTGHRPTEDAPRPRELRPDTPGDLDDLCARTLAGEGPRSTGELLRLLAPWPGVDPQAMTAAVAVPAPPGETASEEPEPDVVAGDRDTGQESPSTCDADDEDGAADTGDAGEAGGTDNTAGDAEDVENPDDKARAGGAAAGLGAAAGGVTAAGIGLSHATRPTTRPSWSPVRGRESAPLPTSADEAGQAPPPPPPPPPPADDAPAETTSPGEADTDAPTHAPASEGVPAGTDQPDQTAQPDRTFHLPAGERHLSTDVPNWSEVVGRLEMPTEAQPVTPARTISWTPPGPPDTSAPPAPFPELVSSAEATGGDAAHPAGHGRGGQSAAAVAAAATAETLRNALGKARGGAERTVERTRQAAAAARNPAAARRAERDQQDAPRPAEPDQATERTGYGTAGAATTPATAGTQAPPQDGEPDLLSEVDGPEVPFAERRMNPTPVVIVGVVALVVILFLISLRTILAPPPRISLPDNEVTPTAEETTEEETTEEPTEEETTTEEPTEEVEPVIADLSILDPEGDGQENPELTPRALDGDAETFWRSRSYVDPEYGMKSGIGLAVDLEEPSTVRRVEIDLMGQGGNVEIRDTSAENPTDGEPLANGEMGPDSVFEFDEPVQTDTLVLWFTRLPVAESDGLNRVELAELRVG